MSLDRAPVHLLTQAAQLWSRAWQPRVDRHHTELADWLGLDRLSADEMTRAERMRRRGKHPHFVADRLLAARARAARSPVVGYRLLDPSGDPSGDPAPEPTSARRSAIHRPEPGRGWSITWSAGRSSDGARAVLRWGAPEHRPGATSVDPSDTDHNHEGDFVHLRVTRAPRSPRPGERPGTRRPGAAT